MYLVVFLVLVVSMLLCHFIATGKGRNPIAWGVTGAILGPFAVLIILLLPKAK